MLREDDEGDEEGRKVVLPFLDRKLVRGSVVVLPADPKHWLLQSLRLQESELQELFDQVGSSSKQYLNNRTISFNSMGLFVLDVNSCDFRWVVLRIISMFSLSTCDGACSETVFEFELRATHFVRFMRA